MFQTAGNLIQSSRLISMVRSQKSPAPFVVHMRWLLLTFCFTFPFTIMAYNPLFIVNVQSIVSFSLLGIEYCSREMEHPFGDDKADIPMKLILKDARMAVREAWESPERARGKELKFISSVLAKNEGYQKGLERSMHSE